MKVPILLAVIAFALVFGVHAYFYAQPVGQGPWATVDENAEAPETYAAVGLWLGLSYATAAGFAVFCLGRLYRQRQRAAAAGAVGGIALSAFLWGAGCFLIGCCGSPMLPIYLSLLGPRFVGLRGPVIFIITIASVVLGFFMVLRRKQPCNCGPGGCCPDEPAE